MPLINLTKQLQLSRSKANGENSGENQMVARDSNCRQRFWEVLLQVEPRWDKSQPRLSDQYKSFCLIKNMNVYIYEQG